MKRALTYHVLSVLMAISAMHGQTTSPIVGFTQMSAPGTQGSGASQLSFHSLSLSKMPLYRGAANTVSGDKLTDTAATWTDGAFAGNHYLEIVSSNGSTTAAGVGTYYNIVSNVAATGVITIEGTLNAGLTAPVVYRVGKHWTLADVFGETNSAGLQGGTATTADQVILWNGPGFSIYYYQTSGIGGIGWRKMGAQSSDASTTIIPPNVGLLIRRGQSSTANIMIIGAVKSGQTTQRLLNGYNYVGNPFSAAMTLASCGLYIGNSSTGLLGSNLATDADQVLIWSGSGYTTYYYNTAVNGWRMSTDQDTDASATSIGAGVGFIVLHRGANSFTWTAPQHPASF